MSGDEVVRHEKSGPREAFFHGRSVSDRCDVCKLSETLLQVGELQKKVEKLEDDKETLREACETVYYQITNHGNMGDDDLAALVSNAMNEVVEKRVDAAPKQAPKCDHGNWIVDGDRDICGKCGSRANPVM